MAGEEAAEGRAAGQPHQPVGEGLKGQGQRHGRQSGRRGEVGKQVVGDDGDPQQDHLGIDKLHEKPGEKVPFSRVPPLRVLAVQALPCLIEHVGGAHQAHQRLKEGEGVVKDLGEGQAQQHDGAQPAQHPQVQPDPPAKALPPSLLQSHQGIGAGGGEGHQAVEEKVRGRKHRRLLWSIRDQAGEWAARLMR